MQLWEYILMHGEKHYTYGCMESDGGVCYQCEYNNCKSNDHSSSCYSLHVTFIDVNSTNKVSSINMLSAMCNVNDTIYTPL